LCLFKFDIDSNKLVKSTAGLVSCPQRFPRSWLNRWPPQRRLAERRSGTLKNGLSAEFSVKETVTRIAIGYLWCGWIELNEDIKLKCRPCRYSGNDAMNTEG
jgi:hypothetical protein